MIIGVPKEVKSQEYRVGLIPQSVRELVKQGHQVVIETQAGLGIGFKDDDYLVNGQVTIAADANQVYEKADLIVKVKEPQPSEFSLIRKNQIILAYLHLAPDPAQAEALLQSDCIAIGYETVTDMYGKLPLLTPMSEIAGRFAIQAGAYCLQKSMGGKGILLGGVAGVCHAKVVVIGGGAAGRTALGLALGHEALVTVIDNSIPRLRELDQLFGSRLETIYSTQSAIEEAVLQADLVIGAVLVPGGTTPKLVSRELVSKMQQGSVIVDVSIDQGGCFETSHPTTFNNPTFVIDGVVHYCVTNMPGGVPRTATFALNNVTLPFIVKLANKGYKEALLEDIHLRNGLNVFKGKITHKAVALALHKPFHVTEALLT